MANHLSAFPTRYTTERSVRPDGSDYFVERGASSRFGPNAYDLNVMLPTGIGRIFRNCAKWDCMASSSMS
jgi:hypothetical protein